jgi:hypothetical protein
MTGTTPSPGTRTCDVCARRRDDVTLYADEHDVVACCSECDSDLKQGWDALTPEQQAAMLAGEDDDA